MILMESSYKAWRIENFTLYDPEQEKMQKVLLKSHNLKSNVSYANFVYFSIFVQFAAYLATRPPKVDVTYGWPKNFIAFSVTYQPKKM
jgi:hypothetical protein